MEKPTSRILAIASLALSLNLPLTALAQDAQYRSNATGVSVPSTITVTNRNSIDAFASAQSDGSETISNSGSFQQLGGLQVQVRTRQQSTMLVTFSAECTVRSPTVDAAIVVEVQVDGVTVPGFGSVIFCSNKDFYYESHSFQWVAEAATRRPVITVRARTLDADANTVAILGDRILTVMYTQR